MYNNNGLKSIRHMDDLGSSRLATTRTHTVYAKESYAPFGEAYNETGTQDRVFTGQTQDTTSGVYDYLFRKYDPTAGRWLSPDPAGWDAVDEANPQSLNRYAYVENDPMSYADPLGLMQYCTTYAQFWAVSADGSPGNLSGPASGIDYYPYCTNIPDLTTQIQSYPDGTPSFSFAPSNAKQITQQCDQEFYNSGFGKAVNFFSLGSLVPGWGPNPMESLKEWGLSIVGKGGGGTALVYALNREGTFTTLSGTVSAGSHAMGAELINGALHFTADLATGTMVAATGIDVLMHYGCFASAMNATGQANFPVYVAP